MSSPPSAASVVSAAVALLFQADHHQSDAIDYQRFLGAVTGDPLIGARYTREQIVEWARAIVAAVHKAAESPPV